MSLYVYFVIIAMLFSLTLVYNIFSPVFVGINPEIRTFINDTNASSSMKTKAINVIGYLENSWTYVILYFMLMLLIWGFVASQKEEPYHYR